MGKVKIADPKAPADPAPKGKGKGHGVSRFFTVADRFKGHLDSIALPVDFMGPWTMEKMELLRLVPALHEEFNERWVHSKLRSYAAQPTEIQPPLLQCKTMGKTGKLGTSEVFDARLLPMALQFLNDIAIQPDKCKKETGTPLEWDDGEDSSPAEEEPRPVPVQRAPAPPALPVAAAGATSVSAPYKCKLVWELENNKTKDHGKQLTTAQTLSKNRMVFQFFEAPNCFLTGLTGF